MTPCLAATSTNMSAMGITYSSLGVARFKSLKSVHTHTYPFLFITSTIFDNHSVYLVVLIKLAPNILSISH